MAATVLARTAGGGVAWRGRRGARRCRSPDVTRHDTLRHGGGWWVPLVIPEVWCGPVPLGRSTPASTRCSGTFRSIAGGQLAQCAGSGVVQRVGGRGGDGGVGTLVSWATRSARASSQRRRPATASLLRGGSARRPSSSNEAWRWCSPQGTDRQQVLRGVLAEDAHRLLNPGGAGRGGGRGAFLVGGVEGANRLPVLRCCARRRRRSCQPSRLSGASIRVSSAPMASSSRTRTRCAPRTSRVFAVIPTAGPPRPGPAPSPGPDNALPRRGSDPAQ